MLERVLAAYLFRFPAGLGRGGVKQARVVISLALMGAFFHALQGTFLAAFGHTELGAVNTASVACYLSVVLLMRRGRALLAVWLIGAELLAYNTGMALYIGAEGYYHLYYLTGIVGAYLAFRPEQVRHRRVWIVLFVIIGAATTWACRWIYPPDTLTPELVGQIALLNQLTNGLVLVLASAYFARVSHLAEAEADAERERSEKLLLNILPAPIAERLKAEPGTIADHFPAVTVLFSDIVGFTQLSAKISTEELIQMLNDVFSTFDRLAQKHGLEKIKTIGDAYMVVGGLPEPTEDHAERVVDMALDMRVAIQEYGARSAHALDVRIGVHTGPVVAGVIGVEKFAYDLWGDTVNIASRMESHGEKGRVHVSQATRDALPAAYDVEERGEIEVKGKGRMRTFFVNARRD